MSQIVEIADLIIKIDPEMPGKLLVHRNRIWELFFDGSEVFGEQIHNLGVIGNGIIVYAMKGRFISEDFGITWTKNIFQNPHKLFLDDVRPVPDGFVGVRSYREFVLYIQQNELPQFISFDHDLGEEKSGFDCAEFLVEYCLDRNIPTINFAVHSQNPVGKENIESLLNSYNKHHLK